MRICVVTGTRAEFGLLRGVIEGIAASQRLELQLLATGAHLSPEFGSTVREIEAAGIAVDRRVEMLVSGDTGTAMAKSMGLGLIGFADALDSLRPDLVLVLGDRFECFAAAAAATALRLPIAHVHGGERTEGAVDDAFRHAITKLSHLHFVAAEEYRRRVVQMGEAPDTVHLVGALGVDAIARLQLLDRDEVERRLDFELGTRSLLVTFHPATLDAGEGERQVDELLGALAELRDVRLVFTLPNADTESRAIKARIEAFVGRHTHARAYRSLGQLLYLSCMRQVDGVVGNSSSGLIEAPSLGKGTIDIGDRQRGRLRGSSVINCAPERAAIAAAIARLYSQEFRSLLASAENPYGTPGAARRIVAVLEQVDPSRLLKKSFCDHA